MLQTLDTTDGSSVAEAASQAFLDRILKPGISTVAPSVQPRFVHWSDSGGATAVGSLMPASSSVPQ